MTIRKVILRSIRLPFVDFFETSFGRTYEKEAVLIEVQSDSLSGWGECVAAEAPFFSCEDRHTAWHVLSRFLVPLLLQNPAPEPESFQEKARVVRGHPMAKAGLECALWDLAAREQGVALWRLLQGTLRRIPCGAAVGIQDSVEELLEKIAREVDAGYLKIKVKVKPGWDLEVLERIRARFPDIPLMVDANSAYELSDLDHLKGFDQWNLMMVEQPLSHDDLRDHARLQENLRTPICLDESIRHSRDAALALDLGACRIINVKLGRVGGPGEAIRVHDLCRSRGVPVWCGGMLETGIGRAHNIALSTLPNFTIPGDVSAGRRYFQRDVIVPEVEVEEGYVSVPDRPGIGYEVDLDWINRITENKLELKR